MKVGAVFISAETSFILYFYLNIYIYKYDMYRIDECADGDGCCGVLCGESEIHTHTDTHTHTATPRWR
jgi:hypothetical protein